MAESAAHSGALGEGSQLKHLNQQRVWAELVAATLVDDVALVTVHDLLGLKDNYKN